MANTETEPDTRPVARSATNKNFPAGSITIIAGTTGAGPGLNGTGLPTGGAFPSELILNTWMPVVPPFGHEELTLRMVKAKVPAGFTTSDVGTPCRTQT